MSRVKLIYFILFSLCRMCCDDILTYLAFFLPVSFTCSLGSHRTCSFLLLQQFLPSERKAVQIRYVCFKRGAALLRSCSEDKMMCEGFSALAGIIRVKILPKIETKGLTSEDVSSLSDQSYHLMRAAFLEISGSVPRSNGPLKH